MSFLQQTPKLVLRVFILLSILGCKDGTGQNDLKDFYFDLNDFETPIVYKYENPNSPEDTQYWEFSSDINLKELTTKTYNSKVEQIELFKEKYTNIGSELIKYEPINNGISTNTKIKNNKVYNWGSREPYSYSVEYMDAKYGKTIFEKERKYAGKEQIKIMGKLKEAVKFEGTYSFKFLDHNEEYKYHQYSYYIKGLGFVRYDRFFPDGDTVQLVLTKIFTEDDN